MQKDIRYLTINICFADRLKVVDKLFSVGPVLTKNIGGVIARKVEELPEMMMDNRRKQQLDSGLKHQIADGVQAMRKLFMASLPSPPTPASPPSLASLQSPASRQSLPEDRNYMVEVDYPRGNTEHTKLEARMAFNVKTPKIKPKLHRKSDITNDENSKNVFKNVINVFMNEQTQK